VSVNAVMIAAALFAVCADTPTLLQATVHKAKQIPEERPCVSHSHPLSGEPNIGKND